MRGRFTGAFCVDVMIVDVDVEGVALCVDLRELDIGLSIACVICLMNICI